MNTWSLETLPDDILFVIFDICNLCDFEQLEQVCTRFRRIIRRYWDIRYRELLVTNQVAEEFRKRSNLLLSSYSKYVISQNWVRGSYQKRKLYIKDGLRPRLQLTSDKLWWNSENNITFGLGRHKTNNFSCDLTLPTIRDHIKKFILWREYIVTGHSNGSIMWQAESPVKNNTGCIIKKEIIIHNNLISALDARSNVICSASGSKYAIIKVENNLDVDSINTNNIIRRVIPRCTIRSLAIHPSGTNLIVVCNTKFFAFDKILYFDLEKNLEIRKHIPYKTEDILWEDPNTTLMCSSYEIHKSDFRMKNQYVWHNSIDRKICCISSDHHNTMITGTDDCKAVLWDQRMHNYVQMYSVCDHLSINPIYSLRFDSTKLYCATNQYLYELDFSKRRCSNYKSNSEWDQIQIREIISKQYSSMAG